MTVQLTIRHATQADLPKILKLENEIFAPLGTAEDPEVIKARLEVFNEGFLVAAKDETITGYASSEKWLADRPSSLNQDPRLTHQHGGQIFCVTALAVNKDQQGRGIGSMLLSQLIEIARMQHCSHITLETTQAAKFYRGHGFCEISQTTKSNIVFFTMQLRL